MAKQQLTLLGRKPTHRIYRVISNGSASSWTPIGAAWANKDGKGFSIACDAVPLTGRIVMREIIDRPTSSTAIGGQK